jgi:multiple sugar transport system permease protein
VAIFVSAAKVMEALIEVIGAGLALSVALRGLAGLVVAGMLAMGLQGIAQQPDEEDACLGPKLTPQRDWYGPMRLAIWACVAAIILATLIGYVSFAAFLVEQIVWVTFIGCGLYLLLTLARESIGQGLQPQARVGRALMVTALMTAIITLGQLTFSVLAAYAFARLEFRGRDGLFWLYVATLMVPGTVTVVPLYLMMAEMGLRNTFWALVLPFLFGSPYAIFLLREYFRSIPDDLLNAAKLDGANTLDVIVHVVLPSSKPILATLTLITVVSQWNSFMWPLVITSGERWRVLTVATAGLQSQYNAQWTLVMAATTVAILPLVVLFAMFQRHIVRSIVVTGLK